MGLVVLDLHVEYRRALAPLLQAGTVEGLSHDPLLAPVLMKRAGQGPEDLEYTSYVEVGPPGCVLAEHTPHRIFEDHCRRSHCSLERLHAVIVLA